MLNLNRTVVFSCDADGGNKVNHLERILAVEKAKVAGAATEEDAGADGTGPHSPPPPHPRHPLAPDATDTSNT